MLYSAFPQEDSAPSRSIFDFIMNVIFDVDRVPYLKSQFLMKAFHNMLHKDQGVLD